MSSPPSHTPHGRARAQAYCNAHDAGSPLCRKLLPKDFAAVHAASMKKKKKSRRKGGWWPWDWAQKAHDHDPEDEL